jgi:RNA polymerase sigma-70 factor (sigma-E family)
MSREQEFAEFARARMGALYRSAWLLCGDTHRAEDLTQETLAKVFAHWGPRLQNPAAYAQTTLVRTWISQQRRRTHHEHPYAALPDAPTPVEDADLRMVLRAALGELEPLDRAVVVLRYLDDLPVAEVARVLGHSPTAVRSRAKRALDKVRTTLGMQLCDLTFSQEPR